MKYLYRCPQCLDEYASKEKNDNLACGQCSTDIPYGEDVALVFVGYKFESKKER